MTRELAAKVDFSDQIVQGSKSPAVPHTTNSIGKSAMLEPVESATDWRFHLAALARVSDNLVSRAVNAYDRLFGLDQEEASEIHYELGKRLAEEDRLEESVSALRNVLRARPHHAEALYELGKVQLRRGASRAAVEALQRAKTAGLKSTKLRLLLAEALVSDEKFQEALKETEAALKTEPDVADIHYRHAMVLDRLERHAEAAAVLENAIRIAPHEVRYHQSLGFTLESLGRREDAVRSFKRALEFERSRELGRAAE
jgi:tetratricopeptide (TPR) repeat protein